MKLLTATGEEAFELMADLIDPISDIAADADILRCYKTNQKMKAIKFAMKKHPKTMTEIMAICEGVPVSEYKKTAPEMLIDVLTVVNHPTVAVLFTSQAQDVNSVTSSGSVTENTEVSE